MCKMEGKKTGTRQQETNNIRTTWTNILESFEVPQTDFNNLFKTFTYKVITQYTLLQPVVVRIIITGNYNETLCLSRSTVVFKTIACEFPANPLTNTMLCPASCICVTYPSLSRTRFLSSFVTLLVLFNGFDLKDRFEKKFWKRLTVILHKLTHSAT
jgi:hypothetical protein